MIVKVCTKMNLIKVTAICVSNCEGPLLYPMRLDYLHKKSLMNMDLNKWITFKRSI